MLKNRIFYSFMLSVLMWQSINSASTQPVAIKPASTRALAIPYTGVKFPTLPLWIAAFRELPLNREGADFRQDSGFASLDLKHLQWQEFARVLELWLNMMQTGPMQKDAAWQMSNTGIKKPLADPFFDSRKTGFFMPFAQKLVVQPQAQFYIRGDLHGDIFSLLIQLKQMQKAGVIDDKFRIISDNVWILFLGDYVDRGQYGCEVLYTMMRLAIANPDRVFFVRGNHEDIGLTSVFKGGFREEVFHKFNDYNGEIHKTISRMNDFLPVVLYLGCLDTVSGVTNYVQCCHGGIEIGYDPKPFLDDHVTSYELLGLLHRKKFVDEFNAKFDKKVGWLAWGLGLVKKPAEKTMASWWQSIKDILQDNVKLKGPQDASNLGFMWYDFDVSDLQQVQHEKGRGVAYGQTATQQILELQSSDSSKICGIFRAHQHGDPDMMEALKVNRGIVKLWRLAEPALAPKLRTCHDGLVWTFNVGPDSGFGQNFRFNFDAYAQFTIDATMQQWKLMVFNTTVVPQTLRNFS